MRWSIVRSAFGTTAVLLSREVPPIVRVAFATAQYCCHARWPLHCLAQRVLLLLAAHRLLLLLPPPPLIACCWLLAAAAAVYLTVFGISAAHPCTVFSTVLRGSRLSRLPKHEARKGLLSFVSTSARPCYGGGVGCHSVRVRAMYLYTRYAHKSTSLAPDRLMRRAHLPVCSLACHQELFFPLL